MRVYTRDLPDAQTWITKALLLGAHIEQYAEEINSRQWKYGVGTGGSFPEITDDWLGRACKKFVELLQEEQENVVK